MTNLNLVLAKYITIEWTKIWAQRLSYVGELGYELICRSKRCKKNI